MVGERFFIVLFVVLVATAHILRFHDLAVKFATEYAEFYVQAQKKAPHGWQLFVVLFGQCVGYLFAGKHFVNV